MNCWPSGKYVNLLYMYSILGRGSFFFNYCLNSAWHGGDQFVALLRWYGSPGFFDSGLQLICIFLVSCFSFSSWQYPIDSLWGSGLVSLLASQAHQHRGHLTNFWCFWQCGQILLENEISIFKKLVSRRKHEVLQNFLVNGCSDVGFQKTQWTNTSRWHCTPNHHRLWKLNTGLHATWAMSFSTLPPDSRTLVSKWNTKLALFWKEDFGPLGNSPVLLLLSPGKTPLMLSVVQEWLNKRNTTTVAKFLDTSVCGGSWCLDPSLSPFLVKFTQILESILLDNPHKAAVLSVGCASFSSTLFPSTQLSVNMLGYSTLWTASFFGNECLWFTLLVKGVNDCLLDNCQISSLPHDCVA